MIWYDMIWLIQYIDICNIYHTFNLCDPYFGPPTAQNTVSFTHQDKGDVWRTASTLQRPFSQGSAPGTAGSKESHLEATGVSDARGVFIYIYIYTVYGRWMNIPFEGQASLNRGI